MNLSEDQPKEAIADVVALENYFERNRNKTNPENALVLYNQNKDYVFSKNLFSMKGSYSKKLQAFRIQTKQWGIVDFPENWSCFTKIKNKLSRNESATLLIEKDNDIHSFLTILGEGFEATSMALVFHQEQFQVVLFQEADQSLFNEFKSFLTQNPITMKKSA
jgi:hypothetical protein